MNIEVFVSHFFHLRGLGLRLNCSMNLVLIMLISKHTGRGSTLSAIPGADLNTHLTSSKVILSMYPGAHLKEDWKVLESILYGFGGDGVTSAIFVDLPTSIGREQTDATG